MTERAPLPVRILFKPWGAVAGVIGGALAGAIFKRLWRVTRGEDSPPSATDPVHGWTETAFAAALEGAVFGGVKAVVDRGAAAGFARATGTWPA